MHRPKPFPKLFPDSSKPLGLERSVVVLFSLFHPSFQLLVQAYGTWHFFVNGAGVGHLFLGISGPKLSIPTEPSKLSHHSVVMEHTGGVELYKLDLENPEECLEIRPSRF